LQESRQVPVNGAGFIFSTRNTIRLSAERGQVIKGAGDIETGRMADIVVKDTTTASSKSANGRLILMQVCTMMTKLQSPKGLQGTADTKGHHQVVSREVENLEGHDLVE
jgi:hypothetical protein